MDVDGSKDPKMSSGISQNRLGFATSTFLFTVARSSRLAHKRFYDGRLLYDLNLSLPESLSLFYLMFDH